MVSGIEQYQWEKLLTTSPAKRLHAFWPEFGFKVLDRNANGTAKTLEFNLYAPKGKQDLYLIGDFNDWGKEKLGKYKLEVVEDYEAGGAMYRVGVEGGKLTHKSQYLISDGAVLKNDPAGVYLNASARNVLWDFEDPTAHVSKVQRPNRVDRAVKILQTDLPGLVAHYRHANTSKLGKEVSPAGLYRFIAESGVIKTVADLGFNTIQFLPISQSIDGGKWSFRYLVPYLYAINSNWGNPDDFCLMVEEFHRNGIAVILDHVVSHAPHKSFKLLGKPSNQVGIHKWGSNSEDAYLGEETYWGTKRYQYHNPKVRDFLVQSLLSYSKNYRIDGYRIDNVDGILRHGVNGDGQDRDGGRELLRQLANQLYAYDPQAYLHLESHYFAEGNAKLLVQSLDEDPRALGATAYTSSRETYFFHKDYMPKAGSENSPWDIKRIIEEKEWGRSNSTVADFHNHDAAAGLIPMRATGSYAYDALILKNPELHYHAIGKIKVMEAIISFAMEGRTLDLLQSFLLQTGTFEHDSSIHWWLDFTQVSRAMLDYKKKVNSVLDAPAFWPIHTKNRVFLNVDDKSKTLAISRSDGKDNYIVVINMASHLLFDFVIPVPKLARYTLVMNSDSLEFAGSGRAYYPELLDSQKTDLFEHFSYGLNLGLIPAYGVLVFKLAPDK